MVTSSSLMIRLLPPSLRHFMKKLARRSPSYVASVANVLRARFLPLSSPAAFHPLRKTMSTLKLPFLGRNSSWRLQPMLGQMNVRNALMPMIGRLNLSRLVGLFGSNTPEFNSRKRAIINFFWVKMHSTQEAVVAMHLTSYSSRE